MWIQNPRSLSFIFKFFHLLSTLIHSHVWVSLIYLSTVQEKNYQEETSNTNHIKDSMRKNFINSTIKADTFLKRILLFCFYQSLSQWQGQQSADIYPQILFLFALFLISFSCSAPHSNYLNHKYEGKWDEDNWHKREEKKNHYWQYSTAYIIVLKIL